MREVAILWMSKLRSEKGCGCPGHSQPCSGRPRPHRFWPRVPQPHPSLSPGLSPPGGSAVLLAQASRARSLLTVCFENQLGRVQKSSTHRRSKEKSPRGVPSGRPGAADCPAPACGGQVQASGGPRAWAAPCLSVPKCEVGPPMWIWGVTGAEGQLLAIVWSFTAQCP